MSSISIHQETIKSVYVLYGIVIAIRISNQLKSNQQTADKEQISFTLENPSFIDFRNKLETYICEQVGLVYQNEYNLTYKSSSESGAGTLLDNKEAFNEFLKDYQLMIVGNKKTIILVALKESFTSENEIRPHKKKYKLQSQKKHVKGYMPKESNLDKNEILVASYIMELNDKYVCEVKNYKHCFIKEDRHLSLNNFAISKEIVNKNADINTPPNHILFSIMHSVKITRKDELSQMHHLLHPSSLPSLSLLLLPYNYSDYNSDIQNVPQISRKIKKLDKEFGNGKFTYYLSVFKEQEIRVDNLTKLLDSEYILMASLIKMGKVLKKSNNVERDNQNKNKRRGRPPKKKPYVQQIDSSDDDNLSVRRASTRSRVIPLRKNEIPMRPEIHIPPVSIPSFNNSNNIQQSSSDKQMPPQNDHQANEQLPPPSTSTGSRITITMTSVTTNSVENSNTTTYVTTEILPINGMTNSSQPDNSESENRSKVSVSQYLNPIIRKPETASST
ncbi:hypothetical protein C1645_819828 [Glomus cerebriforme]|uniref:Uncharacterized protein n=1 Tax=Glomus cerebriforme TaxID=658196 RepID=A0A397T4M3_9GLOM|nr:hypothetical protein C1645_819828 [Glomus cerebriforme]